jgi:hypothetical protein
MTQGEVQANLRLPLCHARIVANRGYRHAITGYGVTVPLNGATLMPWNRSLVIWA